MEGKNILEYLRSLSRNQASHLVGQNASVHPDICEFVDSYILGEFSLKTKMRLIMDGLDSAPLCVCGRPKAQTDKKTLSNCKLSGCTRNKKVVIPKPVVIPVKKEVIKIYEKKEVVKSKPLTYRNIHPILGGAEESLVPVGCTCGCITKLPLYRYNQYSSFGINICEVCNPKMSPYEEFLLFIRDIYNEEIITLKDYLYIPGKKLYITFNFLRYDIDSNIERYYRYSLKEKLEVEGHKMVQVWEDDWINPIKNRVIKSRINNLLGQSITIGARKLKLTKVDSSYVKDFLNENHLQGFTGATDSYVLEMNGIIYACATFKLHKGQYELKRYCLKMGYTISGGLEKFVRQYKKDHSEVLFSYADLDWTPLKGSIYERIGLKEVSYTGPSYWWGKNGIREPRQKYMRHKLEGIFGESFDPSLRELDILWSKGYYRVFNSGNKKYEMDLKW